jgi:hypothetical protein
MAGTLHVTLKLIILTSGANQKHQIAHFGAPLAA